MNPSHLEARYRKEPYFEAEPFPAGPNPAPARLAMGFPPTHIHTHTALTFEPKYPVYT